MKEIKPVIVVVAYRRTHTMVRLLKSIASANYNTEDITLIISIDYHPQNSDVIKLADDFEWKYGTKIVRTHTENMGLRKHIIECGDYATKYGAAIILEDDELVAPGFFEYAKDALNKYQEEERVAGISLYGREWNDYECGPFYPMMTEGDNYFGQFSCTRGEAWTAKQWNTFKCWYLNQKEITQDELLPPPVYTWNESWGKYFLRFLVEKNKYYCIPRKPMSTIYGEAGTHAASMEMDKQVVLYLGTDKLKLLDFDKGCHYDAFYENADMCDVVSAQTGLNSEDIIIDLYGQRGRKYAKRYVLTTNHFDYKILKGYDLNLRPHELNVFMDMEGEGIYLYDLNQKESNKERFKMPGIVSRLEYDFSGFRGPEAIEYGIKHTARIIKNSIKK